jgi:hypothetical protein
MSLVALARGSGATAGRGGPFPSDSNGLVQVPAIYAANPRTDRLEFAAYEFQPNTFFICWSGGTADRPSSGGGGQFPPPAPGTPYFDTDLGEVIFAFAPGQWVNTAGILV